VQIFFWEVLNVKRIKLLCGPYLQDSKLGWLISGPIYKNSMKNTRTQCNFLETLSIDIQLKKFWELEDLSQKRNLTSHERKCEEIFNNTKKT
jgi:hypothetical protein